MICLLGVVVTIIMAVLKLAAGDFTKGLLFLFVAMPLSMALSVVFDYVGERIRRDVIEGRVRSKVDVIDTPWEDDPNHT